MDYSLLLGVHYPTRTFARGSLDGALSTDGHAAAALADAVASYRPTSESDTDAANESGAECGALSDSAPPPGQAGGGPFAQAAAQGGAPRGPPLSPQQQPLPAPLAAIAEGAPTAGLPPVRPLRPLALSRALSGGDATLGPAGSGAAARGCGDDSAGAPCAAATPASAAVSGGGDRARNFEVRSTAAEVEGKLARITERMQALGFSEQRQHDIAELARLKILGGKLKKRSTARKEPPSAVLSAMQQARQEGLAGGSGDGAAAGPTAAPDGGDAAAGASGAGAPLAASGSCGGWGTGPLPPTPVRRAAGAGGAAGLAHLSSLRGAFTGLPYEEDEEVTETPLVGAAGAGWGAGAWNGRWRVY
jgi:hypothetical protein